MHACATCCRWTLRVGGAPDGFVSATLVVTGDDHVVFTLPTEEEEEEEAAE